MHFIIVLVGALALVALAPLILRFLPILVAIAIGILLFVSTGPVATIALIILIACFLVGKFFKGGE